MNSKVLRHFQASGMKLFGQLAAGRYMTAFRDDVFLVSYPKSGNTWVRFLVGNLVYAEQPVTFANVEQRVPSVYGMPNRKLRRLPRPRYVKTHEPFHADYRRVIYVVRDPRDVLVSHYHFLVKIKRLPVAALVNDLLPTFLNEAFFERVGPWADHVMGWLAMSASRKDFLFLRYEDLLSDASRELSKVAAMLGLPPDQEQLDRAVRLSTAERMRALEKKESKKWSTTKGTRSSVPFVRAAKSGQWSKVLPPESVFAIEAAWGPVIQALGYQLVNDPLELAAKSDSWHLWDSQVRMLERAGQPDIAKFRSASVVQIGGEASIVRDYTQSQR